MRIAHRIRPTLSHTLAHPWLPCLILLIWAWFGGKVHALPPLPSQGEQVTIETTPDSPAPASRYEFRENHSPDGIGKFYMGREIARVMSHQGADWLERPEREEEERPAQVVGSLKLSPGSCAADIGAGSGYFARRLARRVGPEGKVFAVDIQPEMLVLLTNNLIRLGITNVLPILGSVTNPHLPRASLDLVLMVDVYHEFSHPHEMMDAICDSLKPDGQVVLVEFRGEDPTVPIKELHKMTEAQVRQEMSPLPLAWVETIAILPRQHILVFRKKAGFVYGPTAGPGYFRHRRRAGSKSGNRKA